MSGANGSVRIYLQICGVPSPRENVQTLPSTTHSRTPAGSFDIHVWPAKALACLIEIKTVVLLGLIWTSPSYE